MCGSRRHRVNIGRSGRLRAMVGQHEDNWHTCTPLRPATGEAPPCVSPSVLYNGTCRYSPGVQSRTRDVSSVFHHRRDNLQNPRLAASKASGGMHKRIQIMSSSLLRGNPCEGVLRTKDTMSFCGEGPAWADPTRNGPCARQRCPGFRDATGPTTNSALGCQLYIWLQRGFALGLNLSPTLQRQRC